MSEPTPLLDYQTLETHLERLRMHTRDIDGIVREEIRRTLVEELRMLTEETQQATGALRSMRRMAGARSLAPSLAAALLCAAIPAVAAQCFLPSAREVAALRSQRDELAANITALERRGGRVGWRSCGAQRRLCVRTDPKLPVYGEHGEYHIVAEDTP